MSSNLCSERSLEWQEFEPANCTSLVSASWTAQFDVLATEESEEDEIYCAYCSDDGVIVLEPVLVKVVASQPW